MEPVCVLYPLRHSPWIETAARLLRSPLSADDTTQWKSKKRGDPIGNGKSLEKKN